MFRHLCVLYFLFAVCFSAVAETDPQPNPQGVEQTTNTSPAKKGEPKQQGQFTPSEEMTAAFANLQQSTNDNLTTGQRVKKYLVSGFQHIIPLGLDHILFIVALFLSTTVLTRLIWQVSLFTLAHTITLAISVVWGWTLAASIVEPLIALSIVYLAFENVRNQSSNPGGYVTIFLFGLLHGFGFAFVLKEFGLSGGDLAVSLAAFNIGVEGGQLAILGIMSLLFYRWRNAPSYRLFVQVPLSIGVGLVGLYWLVERII